MCGRGRVLGDFGGEAASAVRRPERGILSADFLSERNWANLGDRWASVWLAVVSVLFFSPRLPQLDLGTPQLSTTTFLQVYFPLSIPLLPFLTLYSSPSKGF